MKFLHQWLTASSSLLNRTQVHLSIQKRQPPSVGRLSWPSWWFQAIDRGLDGIQEHGLVCAENSVGHALPCIIIPAWSQNKRFLTGVANCTRSTVLQSWPLYNWPLVVCKNKPRLWRIIIVVGKNSIFWPRLVQCSWCTKCFDFGWDHFYSSILRRIASGRGDLAKNEVFSEAMNVPTLLLLLLLLSLFSY